MSLSCLVYTSVSKQKMSSRELEEMLMRTRVKNKALGITGILLYLDPFFIQVLEGEDNIVNKLFNRIKKDPRHYKATPIYKKSIDKHYFENWTMGFKKFDYSDVEKMEGFSDVLQKPNMNFLDTYPNKIGELLDMFKHETLF